jgi:hypothetical protein
MIVLRALKVAILSSQLNKPMSSASERVKLGRALQSQCSTETVDVCLELVTRLQDSGYAYWDQVLDFINEKLESMDTILTGKAAGNSVLLSSVNTLVGNSLLSGLAGECPIHDKSSIPGHEFDIDMDCSVHNRSESICQVHHSTHTHHLFDQVDDADIVLIEDLESLDGLERYILNQERDQKFKFAGDKNSQEWNEKYVFMALNFYEYHTIYQILSVWRSRLKANVLYSMILKRRYFILLRKISFLKPKVASVLISRTTKWWKIWRNQAEIVYVF